MKNSGNVPAKSSQNDPNSTEMVVKPLCSCLNCHHWTTSVDWGTSPILCTNNASTSKHDKPLPLLKTSSSSEVPSTCCTTEQKFYTKIQKQLAPKVLIHGTSIPAPMAFVSEVYFHNRVQVGLKQLDYSRSTELQSFAWPAIFRQLNVCMISGPKSGKTMAYLPAVCTFALESHEKPTVLIKHRGPLVIILCSSSKQCEDIFDLIKSIDDKQKVKYLTYPISNVSATDILITIPSILVECVKSRMFNFKKLCHLVLEDANVQLKDHKENVYIILNAINETLEHRVCNKSVQLIVASERWSSDIEDLVKQLHATPLICITNHLEAALYGNVKFEINFMMSKQKKEHLAGVLKDKWRVCRTLILCDTDQVTPLQLYLARKGIKSLGLTDGSTKEDIEIKEEKWSSAPSGTFEVLICSDFVHDTLLDISNAMWIVHYSLPATWTRFSKRFSAFSALLKNSYNDEQCTSFLMIDETWEPQMAKVLNLLKRLSKNLPPQYHAYAENFKMRAEIKKVENQIEVCPTLKLFGKCSTPLCEYRHTFDNTLDNLNQLPKNGEVVFKIVAILDVTRYTIQLIKHVDLEGNTLEYKIDSNEPHTCDISPEFSIKPVKIHVGELYAHCGFGLETTKFVVCRVIKIQADNSIEVELLTTNETLKTVTSKLRVLPPSVQRVEAYLCNLIPPFNDTSFSAKSFRSISAHLESKNYKNMILSGNIRLQLGNTLWLENVAQKINVKGTDLTTFNLTGHLKKNCLVEPSLNQLTSLYNLCDKCKIVLPNYVKPSKVKKGERKIAKQEAFLSDKVTEVYVSTAISPGEFYVRLSEFTKILSNLEADIGAAVAAGLCKNMKDATAGKYCLAPEPVKSGYARALIRRVEKNEALCFYVDYGDEAVVKTADIRFLPEKLLTKLPFQAIQCSLNGISPVLKQWDNAATDILYKYMFEPDTDFFRPMFVKVCKKDVVNTTTSVNYSVLLKDGINNHNLINQLLVDCGLAVLNGDLEDFEVFQPQLEQSLDSDYEKIRGLSDDGPDQDTGFQDFDIEIFDAEKFLNLFIPEVSEIPPTRENPAILEGPAHREDPAKDAVPKEPTYLAIENPVDYLTPEIYWSQNDQTVKLKIMLVDVNSYDVKLVKKRLLLFKTELDGKKYEVKITLNDCTELIKHFGGGQDVQITLKKLRDGEWMQLTAGSKRFRNIHYVISNVEEAEPKRKFLQLDVTDEESDGEIDVMYSVVSDLDSDFDEEIAVSSDD